MNSGQLSLLNQPRSRAADPRTSAAAAVSVQPAAGELEQKILNAIQACMSGSLGSPPNAERIAHVILTWNPGRWKEGTVVTAISRAERRGLISVCGEGKTSRGHAARLYRAAP